MAATAAAKPPANGDPPEPELEQLSPPDGEPSVALERREPGTALAPPGTQVLMPMDAAQVVAGMEAYQQLVQDLLKPSDWQGEGDEKFVKKSGWRKIARAFNLTVTLVGDVKIDRDERGIPLRAQAMARAMAPNGQCQDGDGYCSAEESRFFSAKGRAKLEHDMAATATTRAKNRAISDLVGMGEVSAEEVELGGGGANAGGGKAYGEELAGDQKLPLMRAVAYILQAGGDGPNEKASVDLLNRLEKDLGYFPKVVGTALSRIAIRLRELEPNLQEPDKKAGASEAKATEEKPPPESVDTPPDTFPNGATGQDDDIPF